MRKYLLDPTSVEVETFTPVDDLRLAAEEPPEWLTRAGCVTGRWWIDCL